LYAQVITTSPSIPYANQSLSIKFHTDEETGDLNNYTGKIYAHTGLIIEGSDNWQYVIGSWGNNTTQPELQYIGFNTYLLSVSPDLYTYYQAPISSVIQKIAVVFRSEDGKKQTQDYLIDIFQEGLNINITLPEKKSTILEPNESLVFSASTSNADTFALYKNGSFITGTSKSSLEYTFSGDLYGENELIAWAANDQEEIRDTLFYFVRNDPEIEPLPEGISDGINYISDTSVVLSLYAPSKNYVFVIGDFSDWNNRASGYMKKTPDENRFWIHLNHLTPGKEYAFQYNVNGELLIADPYADKILDPWSDQYISDETYPDLKSYPKQKTSGIVSVLQTAQTPYEWKNNSFVAPEMGNLVIYELLVRDFLAAHDWKTLTDTLDYFKKLGITAIEVMPFSEFEGNESWGYNPSFYFAPDKYYGPKNDLKMFIDSCHARGLAVIQDMVLNHSMGQSPLAMLYWDDANSRPAADNPWYNTVSPNTSYSWGCDFNHESLATRAFVSRVVGYWIDEYKVDGYRFDFTKGFTNTSGDGWAYDASRIAILERIADTIWNHNPNAYVILEHFTDNTEETALTNYGMAVWTNLNNAYCQASMGYSSDWDFTWISYKYRGFNNPNAVGYMESHDEERQMYKDITYGNSSGDYNVKDLNTALSRVELTATFFIPIPGPKMIWQFGELGYDYSIDYNDRVGNKPIRWDYFDVAARKRLFQTFSALNELKATEAAFSSTNYSLDLSGKIKQIGINDDDMDVRIIGNFDVVSNSGVLNFSKTGTWYDYFSGEQLMVSQTANQITLQPGEYHIYTTKALETPVRTGIISRLSENQNRISLFPNPANDEIILLTDHSEGSVNICNVNGQTVLAKTQVKEENKINISELANGMYFLIYTDKQGNRSYSRFLKQ